MMGDKNWLSHTTCQFRSLVSHPIRRTDGCLCSLVRQSMQAFIREMSRDPSTVSRDIEVPVNNAIEPTESHET